MMPMEASIPAPIKGAVNDKLVYDDLASPQWTNSGPAQPTTAPELISTTKAA
jgi:hypothetical protein